MPLLQFGEYRPDVSDYEGSSSRLIYNVLPQGDGYGPFPSFAGRTAALAGASRGAFYALKNDGSIVSFAATATRLYQLDNSTMAWTDVSKAGGAYSSLSSGDQWQFIQFGNYVIAVQANVPPQVFDLTSSSAFADLGGSPPQARYVSVVGRFVVLSGLLNNPFRVHWSGLNAVTTWTSGTNSSDFQDFPDGGFVRGVAGGEGTGIIFQDQAIRRMVFAPGSPVIFQIERIAQDMGIYAPYSLIRAAERTFFYSARGFHIIEPGGAPRAIGRERVDRTVDGELDAGNLQLFMGAADPRGSRVMWAYKTAGSAASGLFNKVIGYDYVLDRWFQLSVSGEYFMSSARSGLTLENLDAISASIDALAGSLDNYPPSSTPEFSQFNSSHVLGFFRGAPYEALLETAEQGTDGRRIFVRGFRPVCDAVNFYGANSFRETQADPVVYGTEVARNTRTGLVDLRRSTRYARFRCRIPAGEPWRFIGGIEPDLVQEGLL